MNFVISPDPTRRLLKKENWVIINCDSLFLGIIFELQLWWSWRLSHLCGRCLFSRGTFVAPAAEQRIILSVMNHRVTNSMTPRRIHVNIGSLTAGDKLILWFYSTITNGNLFQGGICGNFFSVLVCIRFGGQRMTLHTLKPQMTNQAKALFYQQGPCHIFCVSYNGCWISGHLLNKWKHKKESFRGWLFWGSFIALPLCTACALWFVDGLKWGWLVEQRLALDLHTLLNHTDSRLPALPTTPPQTSFSTQGFFLSLMAQ